MVFSNTHPNDVRDQQGRRAVHQGAILGEEVPPQRRQLTVFPSTVVFAHVVFASSTSRSLARWVARRFVLGLLN